MPKSDTPLELEQDEKTGQRFILFDYNRDGDSYRSPWSNEYFPPLEDDDGFKPSEKLRSLEIEANKVFDVYRHQYFEGGVSSVYMWDLDEAVGSFAACFCIQKEAEGAKDMKGFKGYASTQFRIIYILYYDNINNQVIGHQCMYLK